MTKFIKLTETYQNREPCTILINTACIRNIKLGNKGNDTLVQCDDIKFFFVRETVEQIWAMLNNVPTARMMNGGANPPPVRIPRTKNYEA